MATSVREQDSAAQGPHHRPAHVTKSKPRSRSGAGRWIFAVLALAGLGGLAAGAARFTMGDAGAEAASRIQSYKVGRGDLVVTVVEDGNMESASNTDVKCEVAGGSTILSIVKDGTQVRAGDEIVKLDSSLLEEQVNTQRIVFERAVAARVQAENDFSAAKIAVQEYVEGTFIKEVQAADSQITIAMENLRSSQNLLGHTREMARKNYVTPLQLEAQEFAVKRAQLDLDTANTTKTVLEKFTRAKILEGLESVRDAAEARMRSETAAFDLEEGKLKRLQAQLANCVIKAPADGMVVYGNDASRSMRGGSSGGAMEVEEGAVVREGQTLIKLPDLTKMQVKVLVHETKVDSLRPGMRARVRMLGRDLQGTVTTIANQPEASSFFSPNVKQYPTMVRIDGEQKDLKPGQTAEVEVLVAHLKSVISVPVVAVVEQGGKFYCWVRKGPSNEKRPVVLGMSNSSHLEIKDGLVEGDEVVLNPRAVVPEARAQVTASGDVDVNAAFGSAPPGLEFAPGAGGPSGEGKKAGKKGGKGKMDLTQMDRNGDGKVSKDEAPEQMQAMFAEIDANHDGFMSQAEATAFFRARQSGGGGGPGGPGAPDGGQPADGAAP